MAVAEDMSPDVAIAHELITRLELTSWPLRTEGLTHSQPFLRYRDLEYYEDLQAWLASRVGDTPSYIQAAICNVRRVLDDVLLVINYDMEPNGPALWVRKWYHVSRGGSGHPREVEFFRIHCLVIQNLAAELTRAVNLVLTRTREVDDGVHPTAPLATVDTGSADAPMHAAQYSAEERELPQPYPGLREFPNVIMSRDIGAFGEVHEGRPRTPDDFVVWIDELLARLEGARPSRSPPTDTPPRSLPRPDGDATAATPVPWWKHPLLAVAVAVLGVVGYLGDATSKPWLTGVAVGALLVALPTYRLLVRPRPRAWLLALLVCAATAGAFIAEWIARSSNHDAPAATTETTGQRAQIQRPAMTRAAGQLAGGDILLASADGRKGAADPIIVRRRRPFFLVFFLDNVGPDALQSVRVEVSLPERAERAPAVLGRASSPNANPTSVRDIAGIRFTTRSACLRYVTGSTSLGRSGGVTVRRLDDGITTGGVTIGRLDVQASGRFYVMFKVIPEEQPAGTTCK